MQKSGACWWPAGIRLVLGLSLGGLMIGLARAQFTEGPQQFETLKQDDLIRLQDLRDKVAPSGAADTALLDKAAKYYANRLTLEALQQPQSEAKLSVHEHLQEAFRRIIQPPQNDPQKQAYMSEFGKALTTQLKKVVRNAHPITRVNGARLLAQVAWAGSEEATDVLLDVLKEPAENDGVKFWALRGFRDFLTLKQPSNKDRESKYIVALTQYLQQKSKLAQPVLSEEEANGIRYVRREAIRALGVGRHPAAVDGAKTEPVAWWLLKVACRDGIQPEPGLTERVEAAIGVCQLTPTLAKDYNLDFVAHQIGWFVVDFTTDYQNRSNLPSPNTGVAFPWKIYAARLQEALDRFRDSSQNNKTVLETVRRCKETLLPIEANGTPKPIDLETWLKGNVPASTTVFKDLPETTIKAAINKN